MKQAYRTRGSPTGSAHWNWKGVAGPYATHEWFQVRDQVRERDGWKCIDCGKPRAKYVRLHAHHLVSRADWGDRPGQPDDPANLVTVCTGCHVKRHRALEPDAKREATRRNARASYYRHREARIAKVRARSARLKTAALT